MKFIEVDCACCKKRIHVAPHSQRPEHVCYSCLDAMQTIVSVILSPDMVTHLRVVYDQLPKDPVSMGARDAIIELNDADSVEKCIDGLAMVTSYMVDWEGPEAEFSKLKIEREIARLREIS